MYTFAWTLLLGTIQVAFNPDLVSQTPVKSLSLAVLVPKNRNGPQTEMFQVLVGTLRKSGRFADSAIIEFPDFNLANPRVAARQIHDLRDRTLSKNVVVCIGSQALIPYLAVKSELPSSLSLFSLGVLGVDHTSKFSKQQPLPNLYRLRGATCSDITLKMAIDFTEQIRATAGPYGAILSSSLPDRFVQEA